MMMIMLVSFGGIRVVIIGSIGIVLVIIRINTAEYKYGKLHKIGPVGCNYT